MGYEYHWYLRKMFRMRLESTYSHPNIDASKDRTWLCRLLVVFALGETYNSRLAPSIDLGEARSRQTNRQTSPADRPPPGVGFFNEAMALFRTPFEEATSDHVEALNLMTFYSYSLGRRKSAYIYSGLSIRIASVLMLQQYPASVLPSSLDLEHHKRLWWTTFQLDAMTGYELGLNGTYDYDELEAKIGLPCDSVLSPVEQQEFAPCSILTAHVRLCSIRSEILSVTSFGSSDIDAKQLTELLASPVRLLESWRAQLPHEYSFDFATSLPEGYKDIPGCRSIASLYLRYHHVSLQALYNAYICSRKASVSYCCFGHFCCGSLRRSQTGLHLRSMM